LRSRHIPGRVGDRDLPARRVISIAGVAPALWVLESLLTHAPASPAVMSLRSQTLLAATEHH
jgi:hypothetical protein